VNYIKNMKGNRILKTLIPLVAVVIIIESVLLLSRPAIKIGPQTLKEGSNTPVSLNWEANGETVMGKSEEVVLKMETEKEVAIDAVDLYIKYVDPSFTYQNFSLEEQSLVLKAGRSNNLLDTDRTDDRISDIHSAVEKVMKEWKN